MTAAPIDTVIREEESLLERALAALAQADARAEGDGLRSTDELRALRDEARMTADDDLPALLHEMGLRQQLRDRAPAGERPDPRSPYVAHLRIDDGRGPRDYLLGQSSFFDVRAGVRIVDWRTAPIAKVFYRYREGDEIEEEIGERTLVGHVLARRVVVIENGVLTRILGDDVALARGEDGAWARDAGAAIGGGAGSAARAGALGVGIGGRDRAGRPDVTALLDAEQHAAIATPADRPLLVIGSAGSGKTTVALHRFARLAAEDPRRFAAERMRVVVPEEGLARLSRRLLGPLGVPSAQVANLDQWAISMARATFGGTPRITDETPAVVVRLKRHPALFDALRPRMSRLAQERARTIPRLQRALADFLTDRDFLGEVVDASSGDLPRYAIESTIRHTMMQIAESAEKQLANITDASAKQAIDGRAVWDGTPEAIAGSIDVEDLPLFLAIRSWIGLGPAREVSHLVVDEAEDVSLFELDVLGRSLVAPRSLTLAGDDAQQTDSGFAGWDRALATAGVQNAASCRLTVSYRCPRPIVELAPQVLGDRAVDARAAREGAPVARDAFPDEAHAWIVLATTLTDLVEREPKASIAVIARDEHAARKVHAALEDVPTARLVQHGEFSFEPGVDVTHVDDVKGLEWDYVVIPDATASAYPDEPESRRRLHVALTRASWQLLVITPGAPTPILG